MSTPAARLQGTIVLHVVGARTTAGVRARVDGREVPLRLPSTALSVVAGRHEVEVEGLQGFVTPFGESRTGIEVPPGSRVDVYYALPRTITSAGRIGLTPQSRSWAPDWRNIAITFGGALLLLCLCGLVLAGWDAIRAL